MSHQTWVNNVLQKKSKIVEVNDITLSQDSCAPMVDVTVGFVSIIEFQVDIGSSVNLMSIETKEK